MPVGFDLSLAPEEIFHDRTSYVLKIFPKKSPPKPRGWGSEYLANMMNLNYELRIDKEDFRFADMKGVVGGTQLTRVPGWEFEIQWAKLDRLRRGECADPENPECAPVWVQSLAHYSYLAEIRGKMFRSVTDVVYSDHRRFSSEVTIRLGVPEEPK